MAKENRETITTTWHHGPTPEDTRVSASDQSDGYVMIRVSDCPHHLSAYAYAALELCKQNGWTGTLIEGSLNRKQIVFVWDNPAAKVEVF